jgi:hypothetical protein
MQQGAGGGLVAGGNRLAGSVTERFLRLVGSRWWQACLDHLLPTEYLGSADHGTR